MEVFAVFGTITAMRNHVKGSYGKCRIKLFNLASGFLLVFVFSSATWLYAYPSPGSGPAGHKILPKAAQPDISLEHKFKPFDKNLAAVRLIVESSHASIYNAPEDKKGDAAPLLAVNGNIESATRQAKADAAAETGESEQGGDDDFDNDFEDEFGEPSKLQVSDPLSGYNRAMTAANDRFYFWLLSPVATGYSYIAPEGVRLAIARFFRNLLFPVRFINNVLQLKIKNAGKETLRFGVNSTVGIVGLWDPAKNYFNIEAHPEDFGQTLGHYGVGSGFHIVLPFFGPSNMRDSVGMVADYFADPISILPERLANSPAHVDDIIEWSIISFEKVNETSLHLGEYESLKKDAIDLYPFLRDAYEQNRNMEIKK
ncbi:MAG: VacJ family lipoprotein [Nitrospinota bacterium]